MLCLQTLTHSQHALARDLAECSSRVNEAPPPRAEHESLEVAVQEVAAACENLARADCDRHRGLQLLAGEMGHVFACAEKAEQLGRAQVRGCAAS